jgi:hypothetical protein
LDTVSPCTSKVAETGIVAGATQFPAGGLPTARETFTEELAWTVTLTGAESTDWPEP